VRPKVIHATKAAAITPKITDAIATVLIFNHESNSILCNVHFRKYWNIYSSAAHKNTSIQLHIIFTARIQEFDKKTQ